MLFRSNGTQEIFLGTRGGMAVRFNESTVRPMGRFVGGVRGIRLREGDELVGLEVLRPDSSILTVCEHGYGKRTEVSEYRQTNRGGLGVINIKTTERNGKVVAALEVFDRDEVIMISVNGITVRCSMKEVRPISRATQGVTLIHLGADDRLSSVARIEEDTEPEGLTNGDGGTEAPEGAEEPEAAEAENDEGGEE